MEEPCVGSSRLMVGRRIWCMLIGVGIVLRIEGASIFIVFRCGSSGWKLVLLGYVCLKKDFKV